MHGDRREREEWQKKRFRGEEEEKEDNRGGERGRGKEVEEMCVAIK